MRLVRILFVVHHWPPDVNSTGLLMSQVAESLAGRGHQIDVITTFPHYESFRVWPEFRKTPSSSTKEAGIRVTRVYSFTSGKKSMWHRLLNYLTFNLSASASVLSRRKTYEVVFCTNGSFFSGLTGRLAGWRHRAPVIYNVQDLYPEVPVAQGQLTSPLQIWILGGIERLMYRLADKLSVITPAFRDSIVEKGVHPEKIEVIPNFVNTDFIRPLPKVNDFSRRHGLQDRFVITHAGNVGYVYDLSTMLDAAHVLKEEEDLLFLIVGNGVAKEDLQNKQETLGLKNVLFLPFQPLEDLPFLRATSDVQVSLYRAGASRYSMASKLYEIMASGRPVLASGDQRSDVRDLLEVNDCGIYVPSGSPGPLVEAIRRLHSDRDLRERLGENGRAAAEGSYSTGAVSNRYENLFSRLAQASKK